MGAGVVVWWTLGLGLGQPAGLPEVAPPPPAVGPRVSVAAAPGGYRITLARGPAELLRDALDGAAGVEDRAADLTSPGAVCEAGFAAVRRMLPRTFAPAADRVY